MIDDDAYSVLAASEILCCVGIERLRTMDPPPDWISLAQGDVLIEQGKPSDSLYLLVHGRLRVFVSDGEQTRAVGDILPGQPVGEMSLLTGEPTTATVRAMYECDLIRLSRETFFDLVRAAPDVGLKVARSVITRLTQSQSGPQRLPFRRILVLSAVAGADHHRDLARLLATALRSTYSVALSEVDRLPIKLVKVARQPGRADGELRKYLLERSARLEDSQDIVVTIGEPPDSAWSRYHAVHADLVLLVAPVDQPCAPAPAEQALLSALDPVLAPRVDLVLVHPSEFKPHVGAAAWLDGRTVTGHYHVRSGSFRDVARLARLISGRSIGLVLGGGGARGFAQIGVVRALLEAGIEFDCLGGTSMGALMAAQLALGMRPKEILEHNRQLWVKGRPLGDYTFPVMSLVRGRRLHTLVRRELDPWLIEDMPKPFFCVSANLTAAALSEHASGPLWPAVRASGSIPGAGPPLFMNGDVLVDGGVLNNLPLDIMQRRFGGTLIGIDVSPPQRAEPFPLSIDDVPSGWKLLMNKLNPFYRDPLLPSLFEVLYSSATLASSIQSQSSYGLADLILAPPVSRFGVMEFKALDDIVDVGYDFGRRRMDELLRDGDPALLARLGLADTPPPPDEGMTAPQPEQVDFA